MAEPNISGSIMTPSSDEAVNALRSAFNDRLGLTAPNQIKPISEEVRSAERVEHIMTASDDEIKSLLLHTDGIASSREDLVKLTSSPHFSSRMDALGFAILRSPHLASSLGLSRMPRSIEDLLRQLNEEKK